VNCQSVPARLWTLYAGNGDPLLLYGVDEAGGMMLWPTHYICLHRIAFARWCRRNVSAFRGCRFALNHPLSAETEKWARWLGVRFEQGVAVV
jgi:hypothetical protein